MGIGAAGVAVGVFAIAPVAAEGGGLGHRPLYPRGKAGRISKPEGCAHIVLYVILYAWVGFGSRRFQFSIMRWVGGAGRRMGATPASMHTSYYYELVLQYYYYYA